MEYLVFLILSPVCAVLVSAVGIGAWKRRALPEGRTLLALSLVSLGWVVTNTAELIDPTETGTYRLAQVTYLFASMSPVAWFVFASTFARRTAHLRSWPFLAMVAVQGLTVALVATNTLHGWVWKEVAYVPDHGVLGLRVVAYGPWFYLYLVSSWTLGLAGSWLIVREYQSAVRRARRMSSLVAAGALLPFVLNVLHTGGVLPGRKDFTPLGTAAAAVLIGVGLRRYGLFTYRPVSRDVLVEAMGEAMVALDATGTVLDANAAFLRTFGLDTDVLGRRLDAVLPPNLAAALATASDAAVPDLATVVVGKGDSERSYAVRNSPLDPRPDGTADRLVLLHDITARQTAETALEHANAELRLHNTDLDAFARTVAHDLKNPVHAIHGFAEILRLDGADATDATREECLGNILELSERMDAIIDGLLRLAKAGREAATLAPLDMARIVPRALARYVVDIDRAGATIDGATPSAMAAWPVALGDAAWVEEVWANYVGNALKYGGPAPQLTLGAERRGAAVRFWVQDRGTGVSPADQAALFRPFVRRAAATSEGSGLGLSIVARIAERLGGAAGVESTGVAGEGARFWIDLPASPSDA